MRNISLYPLTTEEALSVLDDQIQAINQRGSFGGINVHALQRVKEFIEQNEASFAEFIARKD